MAETFIAPKATPQFPDVSGNNSEVSRRLAAQDAAGKSTAVPDAKAVQDTSSALDDLVKVAEKAQEAPPVVETPPVDDPAAKAAAEKAAAESAAREVETKKADDLFKDAPQLPPNASVKSVEAFSTIKLKAAQEISKLEQELQKFKTQSQELEAKAKQPSPEVQAKEKELEELRQWRAKLDVDYDPRFKEFDQQVAKKQDFIYDLLKKSPAVSDAVIKQIKDFGGPENTNLSKLFEAMKDPTLQKMVEGKVSEIAVAKYEKEQAIKEAKTNVQQWMTERQQAGAKEVASRGEAVQKELGSLLGRLDWFKEVTPGEKATDAEKAEIKASNEQVAQLRSELGAVVNDDSPQLKAILLTGLAQLTRLQGVHAKTLTDLEKAKKDLATANAFVEKVKASSTSRLRESGAPVDGKMPSKPVDIFSTPATDALDKLAAQITETRKAAGQ